jgi:riboflavin synthase
MTTYKVGIADTTFARVNMAEFVIDTIKDSGEQVKVERYTVPGIKDLPVAAKRLFEYYNCDLVLALGMPGSKPIDKQCAHEATSGLMRVQVNSNKHILEVFVHLDEAVKNRQLYEIAKDRAIKHAHNAIQLLRSKEALTSFAGQGKRQGHDDEGPIEP